MRSRCSPPPARPPQALQVVPGGPAWFHPGRSGTIQIGPQNVLGHFGELHPRALEALDAEGPLVAFEVILERIPEPQAPSRRAPSRRSSSRRSSRSSAISPSWSTAPCEAGDLVRAAQTADRKLITGVTVFDVYEGEGIEPGKKSIAIAVTLQPREKTMTDEEIEAVGGEDRRRGRQAHRRHAADLIGIAAVIRLALFCQNGRAAPSASLTAAIYPDRETPGAMVLSCRTPVDCGPP